MTTAEFDHRTLTDFLEVYFGTRGYVLLFAQGQHLDMLTNYQDDAPPIIFQTALAKAAEKLKPAG